MLASIDPGGSLSVFETEAELGYIVETAVCRDPGCTAMHLACFPARRHGQGVVKTDASPLYLQWDGRRGAVVGNVDPQLEAWTIEAKGLLDKRWRRLCLQRQDELFALRPAPEWTPSQTILFFEVFPGAFTPTVRVGSEQWALLDAYCPDPACACVDISLQAAGPKRTEFINGDLTRRRPRRGASSLGRKIWAAIRADGALMQELRDRRTRLRDAGIYIVGEGYEASRRRGAVGLEPGPDVDADGYLRGGEVDASLIARLFSASRELEPRLWKMEPVQATVSGAVRGEAWVSGEEHLLLLGNSPLTPEGWLSLDLRERNLVTTPYLRQRVAHGWPLIAGDRLPYLLASDEDEDDDDARLPTVEEISFTVAVLEALVQRAAAPSPISSDEPFEVDIPLGDAPAHVRLVAYEVKPEHLLEEDDGPPSREDNEGFDEDNEGFDDDQPSLGLAANAFRDWALSHRIPDEDASLGAYLLEGIHDYATNYFETEAWLAPRTWGSFLESYAPRKVMLAEHEIERTPGALAHTIDWLTEVGHVDRSISRMLRKAVKRSAAGFPSRMRDPSRFGMSKRLFTDMAAQGVDITDDDAIQAHLAILNARSSSPLAEPTFDAPPPEREVSKRKPSGHRWSPAEGEPRPDPKAPCPCGSGRRYKKCCKPR